MHTSHNINRRSGCVHISEPMTAIMEMIKSGQKLPEPAPVQLGIETVERHANTHRFLAHETGHIVSAREKRTA